MYKILIIICFMILSYANLNAQQDRSAYYTYGNRLFAEGHYLPVQSEDSLKILVMFKFSANSIMFTQDAPPGTGGTFSAHPNIEVAFRDSIGVVRRRIIWQDTVIVNTYEETNSKDVFFSGYTLQSLPVSGSYKVSVQLNDRNQNKIESLNIEIPTLNKLSDDIVVYSSIFAQSNGRNLTPNVFNNNLDFAIKNAFAILPIEIKNSSTDLLFNLNYISPLSRNRVWGSDFKYSGKAEFIPNKSLKISKPQNSRNINLQLTESDSDMKNGIISLNLPSQSLFPGNYELKLYAQGGLDTAKYKFKVLWQNQPLSSQNLEYAIEMMYYILKDDEYRAMRRGSEAERFEKFLAFWKKKDPTPTTIYNEAMAEYFRRVDYAYFNFSTIRENDGAKTDRGKIYILFGAPSNIERQLQSDNLLELWQYDKLEKMFTFEQISAGFLKLIKIDE